MTENPKGATEVFKDLFDQCRALPRDSQLHSPAFEGLYVLALKMSFRMVIANKNDTNNIRGPDQGEYENRIYDTLSEMVKRDTDIHAPYAYFQKALSRQLQDQSRTIRRRRGREHRLFLDNTKPNSYKDTPFFDTSALNTIVSAVVLRASGAQIRNFSILAEVLQGKMNVAEIAEKYGLQESSVRVAEHRARGALTEILQKQYEGEDISGAKPEDLANALNSALNQSTNSRNL